MGREIIPDQGQGIVREHPVVVAGHNYVRSFLTGQNVVLQMGIKDHAAGKLFPFTVVHAGELSFDLPGMVREPGMVIAHDLAACLLLCILSSVILFSVTCHNFFRRTFRLSLPFLLPGRPDIL